MKLQTYLHLLIKSDQNKVQASSLKSRLLKNRLLECCYVSWSKLCYTPYKYSTR